MQKKNGQQDKNLIIMNAAASAAAAVVFILICRFGGIAPDSGAFIALSLALCAVLFGINIAAALKVNSDKFNSLAAKFDRMAGGEMSDETKIKKGFPAKITASVNSMIDSLRGMFTKFNDSSENIMNLAENLSASTQEIHASNSRRNARWKLPASWRTCPIQYRKWRRNQKRFWEWQRPQRKPLRMESAP